MRRPQRNIVVGRLFPVPSEFADFYYGYENGVPCILKLPKNPQAAELLRREARVYQKVSEMCDSKIEGLVPVELIEFVDPRPSSQGNMIALKTPVFVGTLQNCPSDRRMTQLFHKAATSALAGMACLHKSGLAHCNIKPQHIFFDSAGNCLLGGLDAAVDFGQIVESSTELFLPQPQR